MKHLILGFGMVAVGLLSARSSVDRELENCSGDLTCVSKVLAELIEDSADGGSHGGGSDQYIEFYHDDGQCDLSNLIKRVRFGISTSGCTQASQSVTQRVWGVKIDGVCSDISDIDFLVACNRYASVDKNAAQKILK
ncbi:MAG: hypothetical protein R3A80_11210 [Bdellovibrionota bacterium]